MTRCRVTPLPRWNRARAFRAVCAAAALLAAPAPCAARAAATPADLDRRLGAALAADRIAEARACSDSLIALRERWPPAKPQPQPALLDSLGRRFFDHQTPEAWAAAESLFRGALERRERTLGPDHPDVARSLVAIASVLDYEGRWADALPLAERALAIRTRARGERHAETATSLRQVGLLHFQLGDYAAAGPPLTRSVEIYAGLGPGQERALADGYNNLGELARVSDRFGEAEQSFRRGLEAAAALAPDHPLRIALTNNLAGLYKDLGRYDDATPLLERALALEEAAGADDGALALDDLNLAEVYRLQGREAEAAPHYARGLERARRAYPPDHPDLVTFLNQAAVSAQSFGRYAEAESLFLESRAQVERTLGRSHPLLAQNLNDLAGLYLATGRRSEAEREYRRALALREKSFGPAHPEAALTMVDLARAIAADPARPDEAPALLSRAIAVFDSSRAYPEARLDAYALRAEDRAQRRDRPGAIADMTIALAAVDSLRSTRGGGDETRAAFLARRLTLFDQLIEWQLEGGETERALETHERSRARMLLDQIAAGGVDFRAGIPPAPLAEFDAAERAAEVRLASAQQRLQAVRFGTSFGTREQMEAIARLASARDSAAFALEIARARLRDQSPLWREQLSADGRIPAAAELQRALVPKHGVMLVYHTGERGSRVFLVPHSGRVISRVLAVDERAAAVLGVTPGALPAAKLERIVTGARGAGWPDSVLGVAALMGGSEEGGYVVLAYRGADAGDSLDLRLNALWHVLVPSDLWPRVRSARTAIVLPDGALHLVPFEGLVVAPRSGKRATRFWLDEGPALSYGVSATSLRGLARRAPRDTAPAADGARVLSVTDVAFARVPAAAASGMRGGIWNPLPYTRRETEAIERAFAPARVAVLAGAAAREPAVRAALPRRRYVHVATHGFVGESPSHLLAGLVLAPPPDSLPPAGDDGYLQLYEIYGLPLDCELAVLSACETHRGPRVAGEGAFALSRAFHAAGARRVVASLWPVQDRATAELVGDLFAAIARAEREATAPEVAIALRDAKRRLRAQPAWADVFYWAPFVLTGP